MNNNSAVRFSGYNFKVMVTVDSVIVDIQYMSGISFRSIPFLEFAIFLAFKGS